MLSYFRYREIIRSNIDGLVYDHLGYIPGDYEYNTGIGFSQGIFWSLAPLWVLWLAS
jgi:hypothetical protein